MHQNRYNLCLNRLSHAAEERLGALAQVSQAVPSLLNHECGQAKFAQQSDLHLAQLRNMVTSPGGTSAEAIYQMEKGSMRTVLSKAVWAAYQKSRLLGRRAQQPPEAPLAVNGES